jgi:hypothetical protein
MKNRAELQGFATLNTTRRDRRKVMNKAFRSGPCPVINFNEKTHEAILLAPDNSGLLAVSMDEIKYFKCSMRGGILVPPGLTETEVSAYINEIKSQLKMTGRDLKLSNRMVILDSLRREDFCSDSYFISDN